MSSVTPAALLSVEDVTKVFRARTSAVAHTTALDHVSFSIPEGGATGLVGQSGSGKTTMARLITGLERPTSGSIRFAGAGGEVAVQALKHRGLRSYRANVQMVFQDPYSALNPRHTLRLCLSRPLVNYLHLSPDEVTAESRRLLELVGLTPVTQFERKLPHQLSGGQRQRVVIARALAPRPRLLIADEPVSMLDVSIRADILSLLADLRVELGIALLYITHDLLSARVVTDDILVLLHGVVVERGRTADVMRSPQHEYTRELLAALPAPISPRPPALGAPRAVAATAADGKAAAEQSAASGKDQHDVAPTAGSGAALDAGQGAR